MGYLSTVTGRITIAPPIPLRVLENSPFAASTAFGIRYEVETTSEEVPEGTLVRRHVVAIVPTTSDAFKAYDVAQNLEDAVSEVSGYESECSGYLIREGETQGDVERYRVDGGRVVSEKAELRWPDGTAVDL